MLNLQIHGSPTEHPPLLIVHGLYGSARNWGVIAKHLSADREVIAVDQRNHGDSYWTESHTYEDMAADLAHVIDEHGGRADVLGHSMGGKAAMQLALTRPEMVRKLVVADMAPVNYSHGPAHLALQQAMKVLHVEDLTLRSEADKRLAQAIPDPATRAFLLQSLDLKATPPRWKLNLDILGAEMDTILGWPGTSGIFEGPALFVSGALSNYVKPEYHPAILAQFPQAEFAQVENAGHWLHAEQPRAFEAVVAAFLG
ncbi:alpha/beta fold hydrolase [Sedimentimonas flavescens]|uniref:Alpha/beta fold hydrolase n=1 Tax=Sedimentimonas flavescens TaxID=2851012 RepID=A0ABT2ZV03_9RHOB|nr:alpha/beta fold hydrolase [Sedimentimonas flavescens]MCV2877468.1 alpha/beta fold hydrolase [Sedimentimonas flavescens]WBL32518.1 alpha/beta fold hydrolase [Sinirhodobacter sp. HNIBRBA609]